MAFASQIELYNKTLPVWYLCCDLIERLVYYWSVSVLDSSVPGLVREPSASVRRERVVSSTFRAVGAVSRFGPVASESSFAIKNQH